MRVVPPKFADSLLTSAILFVRLLVVVAGAEAKAEVEVSTIVVVVLMFLLCCLACGLRCRGCGFL